LAIFEYLVLFLFAILGVSALASGQAASHVSSGWFTVAGAGGVKGFLAGILIAVFMYSGWDAAIYVNEETKDKETNPGRAAIASVVILLFVYCLITFAYQGVVSRTALEESAGNSLAVIANRLLPRFSGAESGSAAGHDRVPAGCGGFLVAAGVCHGRGSRDAGFFQDRKSQNRQPVGGHALHGRRESCLSFSDWV
jgi:amino acid transporter